MKVRDINKYCKYSKILYNTNFPIQFKLSPGDPHRHSSDGISPETYVI